MDFAPIREVTIDVTCTCALHAMHVVIFWALPTPHTNLANGWQGDCHIQPKITTNRKGSLVSILELQ